MELIRSNFTYACGHTGIGSHTAYLKPDGSVPQPQQIGLSFPWQCPFCSGVDRKDVKAGEGLFCGMAAAGWMILKTCAFSEVTMADWQTLANFRDVKEMTWIPRPEGQVMKSYVDYTAGGTATGTAITVRSRHQVPTSVTEIMAMNSTEGSHIPGMMSQLNAASLYADMAEKEHKDYCTFMATLEAGKIAVEHRRAITEPYQQLLHHSRREWPPVNTSATEEEKEQTYPEWARGEIVRMAITNPPTSEEESYNASDLA